MRSDTCSAECLIVLKPFPARPKDWLDVEGMIIRQTDRLDWTYIRRQLREPVGGRCGMDGPTWDRSTVVRRCARAVIAEPGQRYNVTAAHGERGLVADSTRNGRPLVPGRFGASSHPLAAHRLESFPGHKRLRQFVPRHPRYGLHVGTDDGQADPPAVLGRQALDRVHRHNGQLRTASPGSTQRNGAILRAAPDGGQICLDDHHVLDVGVLAISDSLAAGQSSQQARVIRNRRAQPR
ncbi:MAG: hypothetical protein EA424_11200 [Planctomycetaceae bacterium]|nr:MAG: hypothetical protein EA424_11200 [Planctomycetaceae bacterium]